MRENQIKTIDSILEDFSFTKKRSDDTKLHGKPITVWLPIESKEEYDLLQNLTGNQFGKKLKDVIILSIEKGAQLVSKKSESEPA